MEKANAMIPNNNQTTTVLEFYDCESGKTMGNQLESLDENKSMKTTEIALTSLNRLLYQKRKFPNLLLRI